MFGEASYTRLDPQKAYPQRISSRDVGSKRVLYEELTRQVRATSDQTSSGSLTQLILTHFAGIVCIAGTVGILITVKLTHIQESYGIYVRGVLNILTGFAASICGHKTSSSVGLKSLENPKSDVLIQAALGHTTLLGFNRPDAWYFVLAYLEVVCSAAGSFLAAVSITEAETGLDVKTLVLRNSAAYSLLGICGLWVIALASHAVLAARHQQAIALFSTSSSIAREVTASSLSL